MARGFLKTVWGRLKDGAISAVALRRQDSCLLLFRLENTELLERRLEASGYAHLLATLSARLSARLRDGCRIRPAPRGTYAFIFSGMPVAEAMAIATAMQKIAEQTLTIDEQSCTPVLSGLLMPRTTSSFSETDLISHGCKRLDRLSSASIGKIGLYSDDRDNAALQPERESAVGSEQSETFTSQFQPLICCYSDRISCFEMQVVKSANAKSMEVIDSRLQSAYRADAEVPFRSVLRGALTALRYWDKFDADIPRVSIMLPGSELERPGFADWMQAELARMKMPPARLVLRIGGENSAKMPSEMFRANNLKLRELGCRFEFCGFGIGQAGFEALRSLEINTIRIDQSFVLCCDIDPKQKRTINSILAMAEQLKIGTVAEGVESPDEHVCLAQLGCHEIQGRAVALPMSLEETLRFIADRRKGILSIPDFTATRSK